MAAALCMIGAMVLLGFVDNFVATVAEEISIWQFLAVRASMAIPLICLMSMMGLGTMRPKRFWAVAVRSLLTATGLMLYFGVTCLYAHRAILGGPVHLSHFCAADQCVCPEADDWQMARDCWWLSALAGSFWFLASKTAHRAGS